MKKKILKYILLFFFFLLIILVFGADNTDNVWNYGVSHAIRIGELPYRDFNTITTPLYQFIMSIGLFIYDSYLTFIICQAILCTIFSYILEKLVKDNFWIVLSILLFPIFYFFFPNYNFLVMLLFIYIIYLEKEKKSDSLIGIILGLLVLTKHSVGGVILVFSLLSTKSIKRSFKRLIYSLIPISIFIIYLLSTNTLMHFLDLCVFGLFDFAEKNKYTSPFFIIITLVCIIYTIYSLIKKKDFLNYYLIPSFTLLIPIMDMFHCTYLVGFFAIVIFIREKELNKIIPSIYGITIIIVFLLCNTIKNDYIKDLSFSSTGRMKYVLLDKESKTYIKSVLNKYNSYKNVCMISMNSMYFDIESDKKITYFDIPLYGNFGYNGLNKMKNKIENMHDTYFFLLDNDNRQFVNKLTKYVRKNAKYVENIQNYQIYYKE